MFTLYSVWRSGIYIQGLGPKIIREGEELGRSTGLLETPTAIDEGGSPTHAPLGAANQAKSTSLYEYE